MELDYIFSMHLHVGLKICSNQRRSSVSAVLTSPKSQGATRRRLEVKGDGVYVADTSLYFIERGGVE